MAKEESELFQRHFKLQRPIKMLKDLYNTESTKKNIKLVNLVNKQIE